MWYADNNILFESIEQAKQFIQQFPVFFKDIKCKVKETKDLTIIENGILYSDLIKDELFLYMKENMTSKYVIRNPDGKMVSIDEHVVTFDNKDEVMEFINIASEIFTHTNYQIIDETSELAWCFYIDYKRLTLENGDIE